MLLSLDISTTCTGYCVFDKGNLIKSGYIDLSKIKGLFNKSTHLKTVLLDIKKEFKIESVAVEENLKAFRPGLSSAKTLMTLSQFNGIVRWICFESITKDIHAINVNKARKSLGIVIDKSSKKSTKDQVLEWVTIQQPSIVWEYKTLKSGRNKGQVRLSPNNYDVADAYVIGRVFYKLKM